MARLDLSFRSCLCLALLCSLLLYWPMLLSDFWLDDWIHLATLEGRLPTLGSSPFDLYVFADGSPLGAEYLRARGQLVWWAAPEFQLAFMRPLSSALLWLDHQIFGRQVAGYVMHSMLWHLSLIGAFALVVRELLPIKTAALAVVVFAIDYSHAGAVDWISSRHYLICGTFALLALHAHLRQRHVLSLTAACLALSAGEAGLAAPIFVVAYEIAGPRRAPRRALPMLVLALAYVMLHRALGYGIAGSHIYVDPLSDPLQFLAIAPSHFLALLANALADIPAEFLHLYPWSAPWLAAAALIALTAYGFGLRMLWPGLQLSETAALRWSLLASFALLGLFSGGLAGGRVLVSPAMGLAIVSAVMLRRLHSYTWRPSGLRIARLRGARLGWLLLATMIFAVGPLSIQARQFNARADAQNVVLATDVAERIAPNTDLVILRAGGLDLSVGWYTGFARSGRAATWLLSPSATPHKISRIGPHSLVIENSAWLDEGFSRVARAGNRPFEIGEQMRLDGLTITILEIQRSAPTRVSFEFDRPLERSDLVFATVKNGELIPFQLPATGHSVTLR